MQIALFARLATFDVTCGPNVLPKPHEFAVLSCGVVISARLGLLLLLIGHGFVE
jgi:hypothetical protein